MVGIVGDHARGADVAAEDTLVGRPGPVVELAQQFIASEAAIEPAALEQGEAQGAIGGGRWFIGSEFHPDLARGLCQGQRSLQRAGVGPGIARACAGGGGLGVNDIDLESADVMSAFERPRIAEQVGRRRAARRAGIDRRAAAADHQSVITGGVEAIRAGQVAGVDETGIAGEVAAAAATGRNAAFEDVVVDGQGAACDVDVRVAARRVPPHNRVGHAQRRAAAKDRTRVAAGGVVGMKGGVDQGQIGEDLIGDGATGRTGVADED